MTGALRQCLSPEDIQQFFLRFQKEDLSLLSCRALVEASLAYTSPVPQPTLLPATSVVSLVAPETAGARPSLTMGIEGFEKLLRSSCDVLNELDEQVYQDMNQPLPHYWSCLFLFEIIFMLPGLVHHIIRT